MQSIAFLDRVSAFQQPSRKALSTRFPILRSPTIYARRCLRKLQNRLSLTKLVRTPYLAHVIARHSSLLYRPLGDSDAELQHNKVTNLQLALAKLDGIVIPPGAIFSFWDIVGPTDTRHGYVEGMVLSNGAVARGVGGGLCQLSNFLMWIFLHADIAIIERYHHSVDAFPDSGRTLPFGSGATVFNNYIDLKIRNTSPHPLQIKLWLTDTQLKGQLLSDAPAAFKYHVFEKNHFFIHSNNHYFRYNEIYRERIKNGVNLGAEEIFTNFAPVIYDVDLDTLRKHQHTVLELAS